MANTSEALGMIETKGLVGPTPASRSVATGYRTADRVHR